MMRSPSRKATTGIARRKIKNGHLLYPHTFAAVAEKWMRSRPEEIHELLPILALEQSWANGCWPLLAVPSLLVGMDGDKRCPDLIGELHPRKRPASCAAARASTG